MINKTKVFVGSVYENFSAPPRKEEMLKLLPSSWPPRWEEVDRYAKDGSLSMSLAHFNPFPRHEPGVGVSKQGFGVAVPMSSPNPEKIDFVAHLSISGYGDSESAKNDFERDRTLPTQGLDAPAFVTPASMDYSMRDLIRAHAPEGIVKQMESALAAVKASTVSSGVSYVNGKYLGEDALFLEARGSKVGPIAVLIGNFVVKGLLLQAVMGLKPGSTPTHASRETRGGQWPCCKRSPGGEDQTLISSVNLFGSHLENTVAEEDAPEVVPPCSTYKAVGCLHREELEQIFLSIFTRIKAAKPPAQLKFKEQLAKISRIKEDLRKASREDLEKAAEEIYQHGKEWIDPLFEPGAEESKQLENVYAAYDMLQNQVRANQSVRENPPAKQEGYRYLGRTMVKNGALWAEHIQVHGKTGDMSKLVGSVTTKDAALTGDVVTEDLYQKL